MSITAYTMLEAKTARELNALIATAIANNQQPYGAPFGRLTPHGEPAFCQAVIAGDQTLVGSKGDAGPIGATGATGPAGPTGATGAAGVGGLDLSGSNGGDFPVSNGNGTYSWVAPGPTATNGFAGRGQATLSAGRATVSTAAQVSLGHSILITPQVLGTVVAGQRYWIENRVAGTGFDIVSSDNTDTSTVGWLVF